MSDQKVQTDIVVHICRDNDRRIRAGRVWEVHLARERHPSFRFLLVIPDGIQISILDTDEFEMGLSHIAVVILIYQV